MENGFERIAFADVLRDIAYAIDPYVRVTVKESRFTAVDGKGLRNLFRPPEIIEREVTRERMRRLSKVIDAEGWDHAKNEYQDIRRLLQRLGTEAGRDILGENIWVDTAFGRAEGDRIVVTDVRFPNEADGIVSRGGRVVRIARPGVGPRNEHPSETSLIDYPFDLTINNDGTLEELHQQVRKELL